MMNTSVEKMKEMHEKMHKGEMKVDAPKMKKLMKDVKTMRDTIDKLSKVAP